MAHVRDRWTDPNPAGTRPKRKPNERWGHGKRWQARWTDAAGREHAEAFGTEDEAKVKIANMVAGVADTVGTAITLREYTTSWQAQQIHHRENTARDVRTHLLRILPALGDIPLDAISRADVQAAVAAWSASLAPSSARSTYTWLSTILKAAQADLLIPRTPCIRIKLPAIERERVTPFTRAQVEAVAGAVPAHLRSMVTVAAATGLRLGELRGLTVDRTTKTTLTVDRQLSHDGGLVWVPPKTAASHRTIGLAKVARDALDAHLKTYGAGPGGLIWRTHDNRPLRHQAGVRTWAGARAKIPSAVGIPARGGWHEMRHYCASLLIANGLSVRAVADWLGHEDPAITLRIYAHLWPTDQAAAVAAIQDALG